VLSSANSIPDELHSMTISEQITPRNNVHATLAGHSSNRLLCGELVVDSDLVREIIGLAPDAAIPLAAEQALLQRWGHDLVVVPFSHGWGSPQQPDFNDSFFRLSYWQQESDLFVFALIDGPFSALAKAWTWQDAIVRLTKGDPEIEVVMADTVVDTAELLAAVKEAGADGVIIGDDIAYRRASYVNPEVLRRHYFPYLTLLAHASQDLDLPMIFHSDGNLWSIWDDLVNTGINGIQGIDPFSAMSMALARERSASDLCLWGNVDLGWLSQPRDEQGMRLHLHDILDPLVGTPTILGTSGGLAPGIPMTHLDALYTIVRDFYWSDSERTENPTVGL